MLHLHVCAEAPVMENLVTITDNHPTTTSVVVAEKFGKDHRNVTRDIKNIIKTLETVGGSPLSFEQSEFTNELGRKYPMYIMDRDAFSVLVFGFNGPEALRFKVEFIKAQSQIL